MMRRLTTAFYLHDDVALLAKKLIGTYLVSRLGGVETIVRITETEAYAGEYDRASHAFGRKRTARTEVMYAAGGKAYVYLCYGMHHLLNVVTNIEGIPHAVLIRAGMPVKGIEIMMNRMGRSKPDVRMTTGPGNLAKALGVNKAHTGLNLTGNKLYIAEIAGETPPLLMVSPRIGVDYAGDAAGWYYRFFEQGQRYVTPHPLNKIAIALYADDR